MSYTKVQEWGLYIGDKKTARNRDVLASLGITHIVNVTTEVRNYFEEEREVFHYLKCPCVDSDVADVGQYFERACGFIHDAKQHGHGVLVHCMQGVSRSASIVIAYLMKHEGMPLPVAYPYVRKLRPEVKPKGNFLVQLTRFGQSIVQRTASIAARMAQAEAEAEATANGASTTTEATNGTATPTPTAAVSEETKTNTSEPVACTATTETNSDVIVSPLKRKAIDTAIVDNTNTPASATANGRSGNASDDSKSPSTDTSNNTKRARVTPMATPPPPPSATVTTTTTTAATAAPPPVKRAKSAVGPMLPPHLAHLM